VWHNNHIRVIYLYLSQRPYQGFLQGLVRLAMQQLCHLARQVGHQMNMTFLSDPGSRSSLMSAQDKAA
jgi:hypothetical protein